MPRMKPVPDAAAVRTAPAFRVVNVHRRLLYASPAAAGDLIDSLSSENDRLWPSPHWPRLKLDRPLQVGASGGHGPVRYVVQEHVPGHLVRFRFTAPVGFHGWHGLEVVDATAAHCVLEHRLEMDITGRAWFSWPLFFQPLHDALIEDALAKGARSLDPAASGAHWSWRVRTLRWLARHADGRPASARKIHAS
jgi:hypothetical protein